MTRRQPRDTTPTCPDCGWVGKTTTAGLARKSLGKHSCDRQRRGDAAAARGRARAAAVDRTPQTCAHKQADHVHGTYAAYVLDACRCRPCAGAHKAYETKRVRGHAYGRWNGLIDAQPARDHVLALMASGVGLKRIVIVSGISQGVLWKLVYGKRRADGSRVPSVRVRPETAQRLLALELSPALLAAGAKVCGVGTRRRLQALVALGWSISELGRRVGITNIHNTVHGKNGGTVLASNARAVRELYDRLWATPPPQDTHRQRISASRARNYALEFQWPRPLAWDDETIDDPFVGPELGEVDGGLDEAAVQRRMDGDTGVELTFDERREVVFRMHAFGCSDLDIERRAGIDARQVVRDRQRLGLPAITRAGAA